jgi:hypothetical protein
MTRAGSASSVLTKDESGPDTSWPLAEVAAAPHKLGRTRLQVTASKNSGRQTVFARAVIAPCATVVTDGSEMFRALPDLGHTHGHTLAATPPTATRRYQRSTKSPPC